MEITILIQDQITGKFFTRTHLASQANETMIGLEISYGDRVFSKICPSLIDVGTLFSFMHSSRTATDSQIARFFDAKDFNEFYIMASFENF